MRPLRVDAAEALQLPLEDVLDTLVVKQARAERFHLTPIWVPEEPPAKRAKTAEVRLSSTDDVSMTTGEEKGEQESSEDEDSDSSGSNSDFSSDDDTSEVSDLDKFEEAYKDFRDLTAGVDPRAFERVGPGNTNDDVPGLDLPGGQGTHLYTWNALTCTQRSLVHISTHLYTWNALTCTHSWLHGKGNII